MMDLFEQKNISPMLLYQVEPFDDKDYIFELKLDGIRCIAYIDTKSVVLQNKRFKDVTDIYPELKEMNKCVKHKVILDGELVVLTDGKPDFYALQTRSLMTDKFKIELASKRNPVQFVAYDILYYNGKDLTNTPLIERKEILSKSVVESNNLSISRYIEEKGKAFFELAKKENLEGVVAKKKDGLYHIGKRTRDWLKIKVMKDEDLIVLGYKPDGNGNVKDLILGYEENGKFKCKGSVYLGVRKEERDYIKNFATKNKSKVIDGKYKDVIWIEPELIGTVQYMQETEEGSMRQPVWKGLKMD
ncbi:MAG: ATP-dependent DNA ligase [Clostridia bacterium]|nr:ATP-dependent DNA ligase [Clostridia bacterium]